MPTFNALWGCFFCFVFYHNKKFLSSINSKKFLSAFFSSIRNRKFSFPVPYFFCPDKKFFSDIFSAWLKLPESLVFSAFLLFSEYWFPIEIFVFSQNSPLDKLKFGRYNLKSNRGRWLPAMIFWFFRIKKSEDFLKKCSTFMCCKSEFCPAMNRQKNPEGWIARNAGVDTLGKFWKKSACCFFSKFIFWEYPTPLIKVTKG